MKKSFSLLRKRRGFGIIDVLNLSDVQGGFCGGLQAAWLGSRMVRKRSFAITSDASRKGDIVPLLSLCRGRCTTPLPYWVPPPLPYWVPPPLPYWVPPPLPNGVTQPDPTESPSLTPARQDFTPYGTACQGWKRHPSAKQYNSK